MPECSEIVRSAVKNPVRQIASLLEKAGNDKSYISFGGGAPSLAPPQQVLDFLAEKMKAEPQKSVSYGSTNGLPSVRQKICDILKAEEKIDITVDEMCLSSGGASESLFTTLATTVNPGEEIILSNPTYLGYYGMTSLLRIKTASIPVDWKDHFQITAEMINEKINKKTKAVLVLSPDNPTGRVLRKENLKGIVELCEDKKLWLITDDIYKDMIYDGKFCNSRTFGGYENTISCCSFSKTASIPGFRIGYSYGPKEIIEKISTVSSYIAICPSKPAQICLEKFLENKGKLRHDYLTKIVQPTYGKRRDKMGACLKKYLPDAGVSFPAGAFYFFPNISAYLKKLGMTDEVFCQKLLDQTKVVCIPGIHFGSKGKNHVRMTFVSETEDRIEEGIRKIADFIKKS